MKLEKALKQQRYSFHKSFQSEVMERIRREAGKNMNDFILRWQPMIAWSAAACLIVAVGVLLLSEGSLSVDALIGLSDYSEIELSDLLADN